MPKPTPSRIRELQARPRQFKLKYAETLGPKQPEQSPAFTFGTSIHVRTHCLFFGPEANLDTLI